MLGEINLSQWKCLAELIDNSVDGFLEMIRGGQTLTHPEISVTVPTTDTATAKVTVRDNGPGMSREKLEMAVRAGWSGSDPTTNLGLFGMGFNIATGGPSEPLPRCGPPAKTTPNGWDFALISTTCAGKGISGLRH